LETLFQEARTSNKTKSISFKGFNRRRIKKERNLRKPLISYFKEVPGLLSKKSKTNYFYKLGCFLIIFKVFFAL